MGVQTDTDTRMSEGGCKEPVVVFVPHRDRPRGWEAFMAMVAPLFPPGSLIIRATQSPAGLFNKGKLLNAAFKWWSENKRDRSHDCDIILHDIDTIPTCARTRARYSKQAGKAFRSLYTAYWGCLGGVERVRASTFERICGFCNDYWGWGGEDDVLYLRAQAWKVPITQLQTCKRDGTDGWEFIAEVGPESDKRNHEDHFQRNNKLRSLGAREIQRVARQNGLEQCTYRVLSETELGPNVVDVVFDLLPE